ncbi:1-phosphatidylinositol-3-phosphate 5-kinase protein [Dioscorea alata]|uniref:1-phosphatidylinositol-3-phosphate 5-kinase protein n=1 Tax=Dioscorea alata TaxID=55571 RepID=A0ACB7U515_DIOAL|nr:1-phosphatidylinositol-3-phosphate 5-kinase protein [Dioscorea alata]
MEPPDKRFSEFVDLVKSWMSRRSEPTNVSRDFWMPDHSCRVCYECDSQFTVFNRRHHCRLCGRVFCAKCTANSVPVPSDDPKNSREEWERIRVCNYCFKQWGQDVTLVDNGVQVSSPVLSPSISTTSLVSSKSSGTENSSIATAVSTSHSTTGFQRASYVFVPSPSQTVQIEPCSDKQAMTISGRNIDSVMDANHVGNPSSNQLSFCINRSDDEDEEYGACHFDSGSQHFPHFGGYYGPAEFDDVDQGYPMNKVCHAEENGDPTEIVSPICNNTEFHTSLGAGKVAEAEHVNSFDCDASSTIYRIEDTDADPVDFENSRQLWLPPEPEDEEDEKEAIVYDDDEEDASGEWGYLRSSNSFGSGEFRSRDRSTEEHKKAMKNVVDGHFRALVAQLLQVENISVGDEEGKESWLEIITSLSWEAATILKPDTSKGGGMDPGGYVKIKCIACGHRSESMVVKGVVCKKNIAHRRMASKMIKPRFLILGGALEYHRITNQLSSFDTLLQQEMDHLKMAVAKIESHHPNVLLVEKSVSRFAQDYLLDRNISLVLNIKRPLLERIARCTGAQIIPSIDHLSTPKLGHCDYFHVEKFVEEHGSAGQKGKKLLKTLMFFEGCPKPLGCTILLKGSNGDELKKVKHVVQYGVFAAYHLALETSFLADEGASLPELPLKSPITVALPDKPSSVDRSISTIPGFTTSASKSVGSGIERSKTSSNEKMEAMLSSCLTEIVGSKCSQPHSAIITPYSNMNDFAQSNNEECGVEPKIRSCLSSQLPSRLLSNSASVSLSSHATSEESKIGSVEHIEAETFRKDDGANTNIPTGPFKHIDGLKTFEVGDHTYFDDKHMIEKQLDPSVIGSSHQDSDKRDEHALLKEEFPPSPSDHQSILVFRSARCVWKGTVCERPHLFRIKYYGSFDKPLGRFLRDHLFDQDFRCRSCEMPSEAHVLCYTHRQGSLTISVRKLSEVHLPGERDGKIWMWHRCLRCPRVDGFPPATQRVVMSDAAWGLSFGKFLELSFSNHAAASRVASCGHSLHRDCLRFYGFGKMVACFRYASINVHSVYLPPPKLDFSCQHQERIQNEVDEVADKAELLFSEVLNAICIIAEKKPDTVPINGGHMKAVESRRHIVDLEVMLQKEKTAFEESFQKLIKREGDKGQPVVDTLELNKLRRQLLFQAYLWDQRLILASGSQSRLHEVLSSFLTRNKNSIEKFGDLNLSPKPLGTSTSLDAAMPDSRTINFLKERIDVDQQGSLIDPSNQPSLGQDHQNGKHSKTYLPTSASSNDKLDSPESGLRIHRIASDGQFSTVNNLSDTFDAKWTGENNNVISEAGIPKSSILLDTVSSSDDFDARSGTDVDQPFSALWPLRYGDIIEDFSNVIKMSFLNFYHIINKNSVSSPKFDVLGEHNPVYISSFRELARQGGARLFLPIGVNDIVIPIYDDEPTSVISYALVSSEYHAQVTGEWDRVKDAGDSALSLPIFDSLDELSAESFKSISSADDSLMSMSGSRNSLVSDPLAYTKSMHVRVSFTDEGPLGKVKYGVTCYYAKYFSALRRICCPSELDFIRSLSRCKKWGAQGGKSNVFFAKSLDDRFIIKQVTKTELESFIKFAPEYFKYLTESIATGSPTCLAKILGIYQVTIKQLKGGKEMKMDVLVMENLLFGRNVTRLYDLKGSSRSRYNPDSSGSNKVLLDQNLIEAMPTSPIFVGNKAKRLLERAVWNDTSFLASIDVMDYSLLVGVDEEKHELVLGIIDFVRQYTWDKHLETWVKSSGILGGQKNVSPTVISPKQYKKRFRKAMSTYFLMVPDQWSPSAIIPSRSQSDLCEDNQQAVLES